MIVVIGNARAGSIDEGSADAIRAAFSAHGTDVEVIEATGTSLCDAARKAVRQGATVVVASGGDGTVNAVASALAHSGVPLGILPMGTLNHFARDAGIPLALADAVRLILEGDAHPTDAAFVNDQLFINNSSVGVYPLMVRNRDAQRTHLGRSKWWAMILAAASLFRRMPTFPVQVSIGGKSSRYVTPALMVANNRYRLDLPAIASRDSVDDGELVLYVARTQSRWGVLRLLGSALVGRLRDHDLFVMMRGAEITVTPDARCCDVSFDGEVASMEGQLVYRIARGALQVIRPVPE